MLRAVAILLAMFAAVAVSAQEFDRVSGGQIDVLTKSPDTRSGSLGLMLLGEGEGYAATFGGTLLRDRLWFFTSASTLSSFSSSERPATEMLDAKLAAQLGDRHTVDASFSQFDASILSLRYHGSASSNLFFSGSFLLRRDR